MAKKTLGKAAQILGGLGAAYALANTMGGRVRPEDVENSPEKQRMAADFAALSRRPVHQPSAVELEERAREDARRRAGLPLVTDAEQAQYFSGIKNIARTESGVPIRTSDGFLGTTYKKGGKVSSAKSSKGSSASKRADGIAQKGKTRGRIV